MKHLFATMNFLKSLHNDCDWLLQNLVVRMEARDGEVESLKKVKAVLSGADFLWFRPNAIFAVPRNILSTSFLQLCTITQAFWPGSARPY